MKINKRRKIDKGDIPFSVENNCEEDYREANKIINSKIGDEFYGEDQPFGFGIKEEELDESKEDYPQKYLEPKMFQDPIDEESYEVDENTYNEFNYIHSANSSNDLIDDFENDLDDENYTIKYINEYSIKMDEDIIEMHSRQKDLRKEAIERYKQLQQV